MKHIMGQVNFDAPVIYCMNIVSKKQSEQPHGHFLWNFKYFSAYKLHKEKKSERYVANKNYFIIIYWNIICQTFLSIIFSHIIFFAAEACI